MARGKRGTAEASMAGRSALSPQPALPATEAAGLRDSARAATGGEVFREAGLAATGGSVPRESARPATEGEVLHQARRAAAVVVGVRESARPPTGGEVLREVGQAATEGVAPCELVRPATGRAGIRERGRHGRRSRVGDETMRRYGDNLSVGNLRGFRSSAYEPYYGLSDTDSFEHSSPSSDKENVDPGSKKVLDDALFEFFRKENKRFQDNCLGRDAFTSYSIKYFWEILKCMTTYQKNVISKFGFGCLLLFGKSDVPSALVRWAARCVDPVSSQLIVDDWKIISISKDSIYYVLGLPNSGCIPVADSESGAKFIMSMFHLSELPHITFFGNKLKSKEDLSDKEILVCFMSIAFKCFLLPTIGVFPNTDFMAILEEPDVLKCYDLCSLVYEHLISGVYKFSRTCKMNGRKPKEFEFCYYFLAVYYLDSLDFGARLLDQSVPRIIVWKGNLIKSFSELDHKKNNLFGKRQLKKSLPSCYKEFALQGGSKTPCFAESCFSSSFKQNLHLRFGTTLHGKIIDGIVDAVQCAGLSKFEDVNKSELVANNVLQFLSVFNPNPESDVGPTSAIQLNQVMRNAVPGSSKSEVKIPTAEISVLGKDLPAPEVNKSPTTVIAYDIGRSRAHSGNSDIASKLELINSQSFSQALNNTKHAELHSNDVILDSECTKTNIVQPLGSNTAPEMHPLKKVKSRLARLMPEQQVFPSLNTYPAGAKDCRPGFGPQGCRDDKFGNACTFVGGYIEPKSKDSNGLFNSLSPISRMNLSQSFHEKDSKSFHIPDGLPLINNGTSITNTFGSKHAPIPVSDYSPTPQHVGDSPEVQIIGTSSFILRQIESSKKGDDLYNKMGNIVGNQDIQKRPSAGHAIGNHVSFVDLSNNLAQDCAPKDVVVILQPKKTLDLPLVQNSKFPVSDTDIKNYCAIVDLAFTRGIQKTYSVIYTKVHCSYISLGQSLMREGHVDNFLIPVFCRKLFEDKHPTKSGRHHFFSLVGESILNYTGDVQLGFVTTSFLGAASACRGKRLELADRLFFPICQMRHWFVFSVDFKYKLFIFIDSLFGKDDDFHTSIRKILINNFVKLWKIIFQTDGEIFKNFKVMYPNVPKQDNADDCGIFAMKFMEIFEPQLDMRRLFSSEDIVHIRIQYANKMFFCPRNKADKSVVLNYHG